MIPIFLLPKTGSFTDVRFDTCELNKGKVKDHRELVLTAFRGDREPPFLMASVVAALGWTVAEPAWGTGLES